MTPSGLSRDYLVSQKTNLPKLSVLLNHQRNLHWCILHWIPFSHVLSLELPSHYSCYHFSSSMQGVFQIFAGECGKTNWFAVCCSPSEHSVCKAELEPSWAAGAPSACLLGSAIVLSPCWNKHCTSHHSSITTHPFVYEWMKERACGVLSQQEFLIS